MERERLDVFVFFDFVLFAEVLGDVEGSETNPHTLEASSIVNAEETVLICVAVVRPPLESHLSGKVEEAFGAE